MVTSEMDLAMQWDEEHGSDPQYRGLYVALQGGEVVDQDRDTSRLHGRLRELDPEFCGVVLLCGVTHRR